MEKKPPEPMTPFDELVTSPALQAVKLLIPYTPASGRQMLAAFVKMQELRQALSLFSGKQSSIRAQALNKTSSSLFDILTSLKPYLSRKDAEMLDMIINLKEIMETAEMMKETSSFSGEEGGFSPMDLVMGMLTPEQQETFRMYNAMFSQTLDDIRKGDEDDERMDEQSGNEEYRSGETGADPLYGPAGDLPDERGGRPGGKPYGDLPGDSI